MFYLKQFFSIIQKTPILGMSFITLTLVMILGIGQQKNWEKIVFNSLPNQAEGPYFHALIPGKENYQRVTRKLRDLPGVLAVKILEKKQIKSQVSSIIGNLGMDVSSELFDLDYAGLKVIFKNGLQSRSQNLIRDYLGRLVGSSKITLGAIKVQDEAVKSRVQLLQLFKNWGGVLLTFIICSFWLIATILFAQEVRETSYIVEQFQRKTNVAFKTFLTGTSTLVLTGVIFSVVLGNTMWLSLSIVCSAVLISSATLVRKFTWQK